MAEATAAIAGLPSDYVDRAVIFLPHPTSTLTRTQVEGLIDGHAEAIVRAILGDVTTHGASERGGEIDDPLGAAQEALASFRAGLREDGADLAVEGYGDGVLRVRLTIADSALCADGTCLLPRPSLAAVIESIARKALPALRGVELLDPREA